MLYLKTIAALSYQGGNLPEPPWHPEQADLAVLHERLRDHGVTLDWHDILAPPSGKSRLEALAVFTHELRAAIAKQRRESGEPFLVIGGDHANAIGIWGAVLDSLAADERFGLLWIDAHMDSHTFTTTPSGNIHGMPLAALLDATDTALSRLYRGPRFLSPQRLSLYGVHSFEPEEAQLLGQLDVPVTTRETIRRDGIRDTLQQALAGLDGHCDRYGISIDLDALDTADAPAVSTPVPGGLPLTELCTELHRQCRRDSLVGVEIAEYYPSRDQDRRTQRAIADLIGALYG